MLNPENAQSFWRPDFQGMDWGDYTNMGASTKYKVFQYLMARDGLEFV